jgi:hypothetical protein
VHPEMETMIVDFESPLVWTREGYDVAVSAHARPLHGAKKASQRDISSGIIGRGVCVPWEAM